MPKRYNNLFDEICSIENLELALYKAKKDKMRLERVREVIANKDYYLPILRRWLLQGKYRTSPYKYKVIHEPKKRLIYVLPFFPDRIVHHAILNVVEQIWENQMMPQSYACRKGKGQHKGSTKCKAYAEQYHYCLKCDISKFYPSINHAIMKKIIRRKIKDRRLLALIDEIIDSVEGETNLPIGNYISQWLGNLYLTELDRWIVHELGFTNYIRYCDDFVIFSNDKKELLKLSQRLPEWLRDNLALRMSKNALLNTDQGINFLGYRHFHNGKVLVRKSTAKKVRKSVNRSIVRYASAEPKTYIEFRGLERLYGQLMSYHGWAMYANTYNFCKSVKFQEIVGIVKPLYLQINKGGFKMRGFPKRLSSRADYDYIRHAYPKDQWLPHYKALLASNYDWFTVYELADKSLGEEVKGKARIIEEKDDYTGKVRYFQSYMQENQSSKLHRLGFTVEEIETIIRKAEGEAPKEVSTENESSTSIEDESEVTIDG